MNSTVGVQFRRYLKDDGTQSVYVYAMAKEHGKRITLGYLDDLMPLSEEALQARVVAKTHVTAGIDMAYIVMRLRIMAGALPLLSRAGMRRIAQCSHGMSLDFITARRAVGGCEVFAQDGGWPLYLGTMRCLEQYSEAAFAAVIEAKLAQRREDEDRP